MALPEYSVTFWIVAVIAVTLVGISKGGFGGGVGLVATPLLALVIPVPEAAALMLPILLIADVLSVRNYWGQFDRPTIRFLLPAALVGIVVGSIFFGVFSDNERALKLAIGILTLIFAVWFAAKEWVLGAVEGKRPPTGVAFLLGAVSGFTSTIAHVGGPPVTVYLLNLKLSRQLFVGTFLLFFFIVNTVKLIPYSYLGLLNVGNLLTVVVLAPLVFMGVWLGVRLNQRFNDVWFNRAILIILLLTGIQLVLGNSLIGLIAG